MPLALRFLHLLGMAVFVGAGLAAWLTNRAALAERGETALGLDRLHRTLARVANWGSVAVVIAGLGAIRAFRWDGPNMPRETWLMVMLLAGIAASALAGIAGARTRKLLAMTADADRATARQKLAGLWMAFLGLCVVAAASGVFRFRL